MQVLRQLADWLTRGEVQKLVVVITGVETREVLERWVFNIDTDKAAMGPGCVGSGGTAGGDSPFCAPFSRPLTRSHFAPSASLLPPPPARSVVRQKNPKDISNEIAAIIRQITASVTFLPLLEEPCTFDLLVYTDAQCGVPTAWEESDPKYIASSSEVRLRSFTTTIHKVAPSVSYKDPGSKV